MTTRARLASNTVQTVSALAENSENEWENEVTDDESLVTVGGWSPAGMSCKYFPAVINQFVNNLLSSFTPVKEDKRHVDSQSLVWRIALCVMAVRAGSTQNAKDYLWKHLGHSQSMIFSGFASAANLRSWPFLT